MTGNRPVGGSVGRRSTIGYEAKASSNEKTNIVGEAAPRYVKIILLRCGFWVVVGGERTKKLVYYPIPPNSHNAVKAIKMSISPKSLKRICGSRSFSF